MLYLNTHTVNNNSLKIILNSACIHVLFSESSNDILICAHIAVYASGYLVHLHVHMFMHVFCHIRKM